MRQPRSVLVTGGAGFIGSAFVRHLFRSGFDGLVTTYDALTYAANPDNLVEDVDPSRHVLVRGDVCDPAELERTCREREVDLIVHFAAESHVDRSILGPAAFVQTNVVGTFHVLEVARRIRAHLHHVSTDEVYGSLGPTGHFREDTPYSPRSPYSASKAASDHFVRAWHHTYGSSVTLSSCSNNYGPYQFPEKLVPLMINNLIERKTLPIYGDGLNVRDWLYVDDHVDAIWRIATEAEPGETLNVGGGAELTNLQMIETLTQVVAEMTGAPIEELVALRRFVADRPGHDRRYAMDTSRIQARLGWLPRHDISSGLRTTVRWYLDHPEWIQRVKSGAYQEWIAANYGDRSPSS